MTNETLISDLIKDGYLKTPALIEAFKKIDRANFVPKELKDNAYVNEPLPIGFGQTISQPLTVAFMIELLDLREGDRVLDVGFGSGWTTAIIASIVVPQSIDVEKMPYVVAIEIKKEIAFWGKNNINKFSFPDGAVVCEEGDGSKGFKKFSPYDKILASAAASSSIPKEWKKQLKTGGRIVAPVGNSILVLNKKGEDEFEKRSYFSFRFVPLVTE